MRLLPTAKNNSFFSNSALIFFIRFFSTLATLLVLIFFARQLPQEAYAGYQTFWTQLYILNAIACLGIPMFMLTYPSGFLLQLVRNISKKYFLLFAIWLLLAGVVFGYLQSEPIGFLIPLLFLPLFALNAISESFLIVNRKYFSLFSVNFLYALAFLFIHWQLLQGTITMEQLFLWLVALVSVKLLILILLSLSGIGRAQQPGESLSIKSVRALWLHMGAYDMMQQIFRWLDKFVLSLVLAGPLFAIYFNGSVEVPFLPLVLGAAGSAGLIQLANAKKDDDSYARNLMNESGRLLSCIVFPVFFFFLMYRYEIFLIVFSEKYIASVPIFFMYAFTIPVRAYNFTTVLQNRHKGNILNAGALLDIVIALSLFYPLYLLLGLPGIALSYVVSTYIQAGFYLHHTSRLLGIPVLQLIPWRNWLAKLILFASLYIAIHYVTATYFAVQNVLIWGCVLTAVLVTAALASELKTIRRKYGNQSQTHK